VKKTSKKTSKASRRPKPPRGGDNLQSLIKQEIGVDEHRLTDDEKAVIQALTPEEIAALRSVYEKLDALPQNRKSPFWRVFCF
jgi:hypothetical protein